jgi:hypothetical protein
VVVDVDVEVGVAVGEKVIDVEEEVEVEVKGAEERAEVEEAEKGVNVEVEKTEEGVDVEVEVEEVDGVILGACSSLFTWKAGFPYFAMYAFFSSWEKLKLLRTGFVNSLPHALDESL